MVVKDRVHEAATTGPERVSGTRAARLHPAATERAAGAEARRLESVLRALPGRELEALAARVGLRLDARKRIGPPGQLARALVRLPELQDPSRLSPAAVALLHRIAEAGGTLRVPAVPPGIDQLAFRGLVFARPLGEGIELVLPTAFLVQIKPWDAEDTRSLRALLAEASFESASAIASHYLGRTAAPPIALSLEPAWEVLSDPERLRHEVETISFEERRLLEALVRLGGEVDSEELMDLERRPMRLSGSGSLATGRRGAAFFLEKRGLLFAVPPARFVVPREVVAIVDHERLCKQAERRAGIRSQVVAQDVLPRRARFSSSPAALAVAMAIAVREARAEVKAGIGTPRSMVARLAQRFGKELEATALLATVSRVIGLWDPAGPAAMAPPWTWTFDELARGLFEAWRRGAAWDEARPVPETLRLGPEQRDPSPVRAVRELVLDGLRELGASHWIPLQALLAYVRHDPRTDGLERLLTRWAARAGVTPPSVVGLSSRIASESLPALGVLDLGDLGSGQGNGEGGDELPALRVTARGRGWLGIDGDERRAPTEQTGFDDLGVMRCGRRSVVADVVALASAADLVAVEPALELGVDGSTLARGLAAGVDAEELGRRLAIFGPVPELLVRELERLSTVVGRGSLVGCSAFLWVDDESVRKMLLSRPSASELFVDPSPPAGLLVASHVDLERLVRWCRAAGVDVEADEQLLRARRTTRPGSTPRQAVGRPTSNPRQSAGRLASSPRQPTPRSGAGPGAATQRPVAWRPVRPAPREEPDDE